MEPPLGAGDIVRAAVVPADSWPTVFPSRQGYHATDEKSRINRPAPLATRDRGGGLISLGRRLNRIMQFDAGLSAGGSVDVIETLFASSRFSYYSPICYLVWVYSRFFQSVPI